MLTYLSLSMIPTGGATSEAHYCAQFESVQRATSSEENELWTQDSWKCGNVGDVGQVHGVSKRLQGRGCIATRYSCAVLLEAWPNIDASIDVPNELEYSSGNLFYPSRCWLRLDARA
jgi:hypothetical protein